ncbi:hypothetical protein B9Z65_2057 [Elsinoe australis]|uniref:Ribosomal protein L1 n=1 Tax=Elsinoe australis TaxID=40998 RepID=A0A2P7YMY2_9PEZI|nr:hypothetical protein B9Z65_2057 [Elsinoe australis]
MASSSAAVAPRPITSKYALDPTQTLRAATALLQKMQSDLTTRSTTGKASLLSDADESASDPIWLCVTTKKHIVEKNRFKPGKIALPHPIPAAVSPEGEVLQKVCIITVNDQRYYKDVVAHEAFPAETRAKVARVIGLEKLKAKYKSFESRRQLFSEYDVFLADDRVVTYLPKMLGKVFYATGAKRPVPISLQGKRLDVDEKGEKRVALAKGGNKSVRAAPTPEGVTREIERALSSALVHLSPGTNTSVKVGVTWMAAEEVRANIEAVVKGLTETYIPQGWKNVKSLHIKGPKTTSLPIWLADEMWVDEQDVLEVEPEREWTKEEKKHFKSVAKKIGGSFGLKQYKDTPQQKIMRKRRRDGDLTEEEQKEREEKWARRVEKKRKMDALKAEYGKKLSESVEKSLGAADDE